jgi:hypothetical protein
MDFYPLSIPMPMITNTIAMIITPIVTLGIVMMVAATLVETDSIPPIQSTWSMIPENTGAIVTTGSYIPNEPETIDPGQVSTGTNSTGIIYIPNVTFIAQAPYNNWDEIMNEEWCEEASMLMAIYWARNEVLNDDIANEEIKKISVFERELFWAFHDTSLSDTAKVMDEYFSFSDYEVKVDITKEDMIASLRDDRVLLVPLYGRALGNPYYTPPGPIPHMVVVIWYDAEKREFIIHDPGTKSWENMRFDEDVLFNSMWMYPTSGEIRLEPPKDDEIKRKWMITVSRE